VAWGEVRDLVSVLLRDPASWLFADAQGWPYPISAETRVVADVFDRLGQVHAGKRAKRLKPHPIRPWPQDSRVSKKVSNAKGYTREQSIGILAAMRRGA